MRASRSSCCERRSVHTAVGCPGSCHTASSATASPGRSTRSDEREPRPQAAKICGISSPSTFTTWSRNSGMNRSAGSPRPARWPPGGHRKRWLSVLDSTFAPSWQAIAATQRCSMPAAHGTSSASRAATHTASCRGTSRGNGASGQCRSALSFEIGNPCRRDGALTRTFMSMMGDRDSISSMGVRFLSGRGSKNTGWYPSSVATVVALVDSTSSSSPMPCSQGQRKVPLDIPVLKPPAR